jgi:hypothetical protein
VTAVALRGEAAEVALAEAKAVLAHVADEERRGRLADLMAAVRDGEVDGADADALEEVLELGLQTGRVRALYGPGGEAAALKVYRQLPRGREVSQTAREVSDALAGRTYSSISVSASGPGAWTLSLVSDGGLQVSVRLDASGARIGGVEV